MKGFQFYEARRALFYLPGLQNATYTLPSLPQPLNFKLALCRSNTYYKEDLMPTPGQRHLASSQLKQFLPCKI